MTAIQYLVHFEIGRKLKDTLMGEARHGKAWFSTARKTETNTDANQSRAVESREEAHAVEVVIKSFHRDCIANHRTLTGHSVQEDPKTELTLHARLSTPHLFPSSLLDSPRLLDRLAQQNASYIAKLYDVQPQGDMIVAILEFCSGGELFTLLHTAGASFTITHAKIYFLQLLLGLSAIHALHIAHRDLSLENLMLTEDHQLRIIDFGLARNLLPGTLISDGIAVGKLRYMSPEVYACVAYDPFKSDIWSCGVILWVMLLQVFPFNLPDRSDPLFVMICSGRINDVMKGWSLKPMSDEACDLFAHIFCPEDKRWDIEQILNSSFLSDLWPQFRSDCKDSASSASFAPQQRSSVNSIAVPDKCDGLSSVRSLSPREQLSVRLLNDLALSNPLFQFSSFDDEIVTRSLNASSFSAHLRDVTNDDHFAMPVNFEQDASCRSDLYPNADRYDAAGLSSVPLSSVALTR